jgi:Concanavalin A-like lectin/glucanases superfamily
VWYHLAVVRSGSTYTVFINGTAAGSATNANAIASPNAPLTIGQAEGIGYMNGLLDEISVYNRALSPAEVQAIANAAGAGKCKLPTASAVVPSVGGDAGQVTVTVSGSLFTPTSTVSLSRSGFSPIIGSAPIVSTDGTSLTTTLDLTGQPDGLWDVVISTPGLPTVTLSAAFTIEPARPPGQVWADIVGIGAILVGKTQEFTILYGNRGDVDALDVPIWLKGIPTTATFTPEFTLTQPPTIPGWPPFDSSSPITVTTATDIQVPLIIARIPPGAVGALKFSLLVTNTTPIHLVVTASQPFLSFVAASSAAPAVAAAAGSTPVLNPVVEKCLTELCQFTLDALGVTSSLKCFQAASSWAATLFLSFSSGSLSGENPPEAVMSIVSILAGQAQTALNCTGVVVPEFKIPLAIATVLSGGPLGADCGAAFAVTYQGNLDVDVVFSRDPNAKQGSQGIGALHYLSGSQPWPYTIAFENEATATAPAQSVSVTDQLDTTNLDLNTFSLGPIGFGDQEIVPPPGLSEFSTYVDLRPATDLIVAVNASLNKATGIVTWTFASLDPLTGQAPTNPLIGFLPPDLVPPEGDGQVLFSVSPMNGLTAGQQINNSASVVFDANPALVTPAWSNILLPPIVAPSQVATTASGLAYSRVSQTFNGTVTLTNNSSSAVSGPLQIVFMGLTAGVTLANATGSLSGPPYLTIPASLAPGQSITVSVKFQNPSNATINFTPTIYSGNF